MQAQNNYIVQRTLPGYNNHPGALKNKENIAIKHSSCLIGPHLKKI